MKSQTLNKVDIGYFAKTVSAFEVTVYIKFIWLASESEYFVHFVGKVIPYKFSASDLTIEKSQFLESTSGQHAR